MRTSIIFKTDSTFLVVLAVWGEVVVVQPPCQVEVPKVAQVLAMDCPVRYSQHHFFLTFPRLDGLLFRFLLVLRRWR